MQRHTGKRKEDKDSLIHGLVEHELASGKFHYNLVCAALVLLNCSQCSPRTPHHWLLLEQNSIIKNFNPVGKHVGDESNILIKD